MTFLWNAGNRRLWHRTVLLCYRLNLFAYFVSRITKGYCLQYCERHRSIYRMRYLHLNPKRGFLDFSRVCQDDADGFVGDLGALGSKRHGRSPCSAAILPMGLSMSSVTSPVVFVEGKFGMRLARLDVIDVHPSTAIWRRATALTASAVGLQHAVSHNSPRSGLKKLCGAHINVLYPMRESRARR